MYMMEDTRFIFMEQKSGRKYELAKDNPVVGYEIDGNYSDEMIDAVAVFKLVVEKMSCKAK